MDLTWPKGNLVNSGVSKRTYLDSYFILKYPSVDDITSSLNILGPGAMLFKVDISRAFRHVRIDPGDVDLLGLSHNGLFIDGSLPFGFRTVSGFFSRISDSVRYIMKNMGHNGLLNYIDDLVYVGLPSKIYKVYDLV